MWFDAFNEAIHVTVKIGVGTDLNAVSIGERSE
jgi:hypothetical protein